MNKLLIVLLCLQGISINAQEIAVKWWNPSQQQFKVIEGQAWLDEMQATYNRLPPRAEQDVTKNVWNLSKQSAGLMIRFRSNAETIRIRYGTKSKKSNDSYALNHMPATGVSGVDLYAINSDGKELWCAAKRNFADTIIYRYEGLKPNDRYHDKGREYRLYLPLYNQVTWMEIGVADSAYFDPLPTRKEKPIVVYGTSIAQGACASRPGMAWTAIVGRKMDRPLINLGFSGNGRLDLPVIDLMAEIEAKIYILDCMPNLPASSWERLGIENGGQLKKRVLDAVNRLKTKQPNTPILLVDHAGYTEEFISPKRKESYTLANKFQRQAFYELKKAGVSNLYYLTKEEIDLQLDDMVDGTHPTDLGMMHYAESYELALRSILHEPKGTFSTTQPIIQYREPNNYDWEKRHRKLLELNLTDPPKNVFLANSIIHFWGGIPKTKRVVEADSWNRFFTPMGLRNFAYGWDRIENVLWRVYHDELDGFEANNILLMIGTNNLHLNTDEEIIEGLTLLVKAIKIRQPKAKLVLMGLLPRRNYEQRIQSLNVQIARLAGQSLIDYADLGAVFLGDDNQIQEALFSDGLHPNKAGYLKLREVLLPLLGE